MKILFASPELEPFSGTGQLAEFARFLPATLARRGHEVVIFTPRYASVDPIDLKHKRCRLSLIIKGKPVQGSIIEAATPEGVPVLFVEQPSYFDRQGLYGSSEAQYQDNDERFIFFCRSVLESCRLLGLTPDVIHCNDWQTGPIPALLQFEYRDRPELNCTGTVFTVHDFAHQGLFPPESMITLGLEWNLFTPSSLEFYGKVSFIKGGLVFSDKLTTISRKHTEEIKKPIYAHGLEKLLVERATELRGIPNGVNTTWWNPQNDRWLPAHYSPDDLDGKAACKADLQERLGLEIDASLPLVATVCKLTYQQGVDLFLETAEQFVQLACQWVFLGQGDPKIEDALQTLAGLHPKKVAIQLTNEIEPVHRTLAGSDLLLMPCRYEPCGANHLYGLRYGTIPVAHAVGSLDDTIDDVSEPEGNGFKFNRAEPQLMLDTLRRALACYSDREQWHRIMVYAMSQDYSWELPTRRYETVYREVKALRIS